MQRNVTARGDGTPSAVYCLLTADEATTHITMITNPWINRFAALVLLFMMYAVGISVGRDQAAEAHHNHPACHQRLKP